MTRCHLLITGRVQGVGFRDALRDEAERRGLAGWVRNRHDGSVEALLQGPADAVDAAISWAHRGPASARVAAVHVAPPPSEFDRDYARFERWPSA